MTKQKNKCIKPKQERSRKSREIILKAARKIFAEKGLDGARIDEIADLAEINKQRIYAYYGSKSELYRQVLIDVYSEASTQENIMSLTEEDIPDLTAKLIQNFLEFHKEHPKFWKLLSWENLSMGQNLNDSDWANIRGSYINHIEKLYKKGQQDGHFKQEIEFSIYLLTIFAVTFFYYSNQLTISKLLQTDLDNELIRKNVLSEVSKLLNNGVLS